MVRTISEYPTYRNTYIYRANIRKVHCCHSYQGVRGGFREEKNSDFFYHQSWKFILRYNNTVEPYLSPTTTPFSFVMAKHTEWTQLTNLMFAARRIWFWRIYYILISDMRTPDYYLHFWMTDHSKRKIKTGVAWNWLDAYLK